MLAANVVKDLLAHREVLVQGFNELDVRFEQKVFALEDAQKRALDAERELRQASFEQSVASCSRRLDTATCCLQALTCRSDSLLQSSYQVRMGYSNQARERVHEHFTFSLHCSERRKLHAKRCPPCAHPAFKIQSTRVQELEVAVSDLKGEKMNAESVTAQVILTTLLSACTSGRGAGW